MLALAAACETEPAISDTPPTVTEEGLQGLESVLGRWDVSGAVTDPCPEELQVPFPLGLTQWRAVEERLEVAGEGPLSATLELFPLDATTFSRQLSGRWSDCASTQTLTLRITEQTTAIMRGTFDVTTSLSSGALCPLDVDTAMFPCTAQTSWTARRK